MMIIRRHKVQGIPYIPSPNQGGNIVPDTIIIHDTVSDSTLSSVNWFKQKVSRASAHIIIGRKGEVFQMVPFNKKAWHAGKSKRGLRDNVNNFSIGIELVNPGRLTTSRISTSKFGKDGLSVFGKSYPAIDVEFAATKEHGEGLWLPYTPTQLNILRLVCTALSSTYNITDLAGHFEISPGRKIDPNPLFPLEHFRGRVLGRK